MKKLLDDVIAFHIASDAPVSTSPQIPPQDREELRMALIHEEVNNELLPAMMDRDLVEIADAMADSIYVIVGAALEYGIPLDTIWDIVQASNMKKVDPTTGKVHRRSDGKILKPEGWVAPTEDIRKALRL